MHNKMFQAQNQKGGYLMTNQITFLSFLNADKNNPNPEHITPIPEQSETEHSFVTYYEIDERLARLSHEMMSFSSYEPNSATNEYRASVNAAADIAIQQKESVSPYYYDKIDRLLDSYARKLAKWTNDRNKNGASCPSVMVCGPANFPTKKKERQNAREDALWREYQEIQNIIHKIKTVGTGSVDLSDPHARELLQDQIDRLQIQLNTCKQLNAYYKKHKTFFGFPGMDEEEAAKRSADFDDTRTRCPWIDRPVPAYELASLRGKIKRAKSRIEKLDALEHKKDHPDEPTKFNGGEIVRNADLNRLQIIFDDIPDEETRTVLKQNGFRWSPKNKAWQRQLTQNAEYALGRLNLL
jgi:hypothetical protein